MKIKPCLIKETIAYAKSFYSKFEITHDLEHVKRVVDLAVKLADNEKADKDIVKIAAWLHDIGYVGMNKEEMIDKDHAQPSARLAKKFLENKGLDKELIDHICECILSHRSSKITPKSSIEAKCVHDADKLDSVGLRGMIRMLAWDLTIEPRNLTIDQYVEFLKKTVEKRQASLLTTPAKEISKKWNKRFMQFVDDYKKELKNNIYPNN